MTGARGMRSGVGIRPPGSSGGSGRIVKRKLKKIWHRPS
jgi:hypothetical protein